MGKEYGVIECANNSLRVGESDQVCFTGNWTWRSKPTSLGRELPAPTTCTPGLSNGNCRCHRFVPFIVELFCRV